MKILKFNISLLLILLAWGCTQKEKNEKLSVVTLADIKNEMETVFPTLECPGTVYGVYKGKNAKPLLEMALGHSDVDKTRKISFDDHFRIASTTKTFVGAVALQLVDEGKLSLNDPISKYLQNIPNAEKITVEMLGKNTSGVPNVIANQEYQRAIEKDPKKIWNRAEILKYAFALTPNFEPGNGWEYSNTNTILLAMVIEKITGNTWHEEIDRRICRKLGLKNTGYSPSGLLPSPSPRSYRNGREAYPIKYGDYFFDATDWNSSWSDASGDMYSTLRDLSVFTSAVMGGQLFSQKSLDVLISWTPTKYENYSYGFQIWKYKNAHLVVGDVPGFSSFCAYLPDKDLTIIALSNLSNTKNTLTTASVFGEKTVDLLEGKSFVVSEKK